MYLLEHADQNMCDWLSHEYLKIWRYARLASIETEAQTSQLRDT